MHNRGDGLTAGKMPVFERENGFGERFKAAER